MTDPQFQTRADLEAWAKDMASTVVTAVTFAILARIDGGAA
jgi:hypothetical protein